MIYLLIVSVIIVMIALVIIWLFMEGRSNAINDELEDEFNKKYGQSDKNMYDDFDMFINKLRDERINKK